MILGAMMFDPDVSHAVSFNVVRFNPSPTRCPLDIFAVRAVTTYVTATIAAFQEILCGEDNLVIFDVKILRFHHG